jgi:hypothetical protein
MKVLLDIKDHKADFVLELLNNLSSYVKTTKIEEDNTSQVKEDIKAALKEAKMHQQGKIELNSAYDLLNEV